MWRALAVVPLPLLVGLWALWRDVFTLDASGLARTGGAQSVLEWGFLSLATLAIAALFWSRLRALRVLAYTFHALLLSFACGAAGVIGVVHAFGGPRGERDAPAWALALLGMVVALSVVALLATAGLMVEDIKAAGEEGS
jgi:hypothetical protein